MRVLQSFISSSLASYDCILHKKLKTDFEKTYKKLFYYKSENLNVSPDSLHTDIPAHLIIPDS